MQVQDLLMRHSSANSLVMHYGLPVLILASMSKAYNTHALKTSQNSESKTASALWAAVQNEIRTQISRRIKIELRLSL